MKSIQSKPNVVDRLGFITTKHQISAEFYIASVHTQSDWDIRDSTVVHPGGTFVLVHIKIPKRNTCVYKVSVCINKTGRTEIRVAWQLVTVNSIFNLNNFI